MMKTMMKRIWNGMGTAIDHRPFPIVGTFFAAFSNRWKKMSRFFQSLELFEGVFSNRWKVAVIPVQCRPASVRGLTPLLVLVASVLILIPAGSALAGGWANIQGGSPSGVYLGDTPTLNTIYVDQAENGNPRDEVQVYARHDNRNLSSGTVTGAIWSGSGSQSLTPGAPQATATGTWYWGIRVRYNFGSGTYNAWAWHTNAGNGWAKMSFDGFPNNTTDVTLNYTVSALGNPTSPSGSADATHAATRIDLSWSKWSGRDVMVVRSTSSTFTAPTQGSTYNSGNTIGSGTVIYRGGDTSLEDSGLLPGVTYYYRFYSENYSYYSDGTQITQAAGMPQARNTDGGASPQAPSTIYLGDSGLTFGLDSWGDIEGNWGQARLWLRYNNSNLSGGTATDWTDFLNQDNKTRTSGTFNQTGTWYWGIQMNYGGKYGSDFWYKASNASWTPMSANGDGSSLSVTVSALNSPSGQSATRDGTNPSSQINLSWTRGNSGGDKNTLIVRKLSTDSWTEPTQGTSYDVNDTIGDGTVVYDGSGTTFNNTGLSGDTTYDYKFYSINNDYYSPGVTAQATTLAAEPASNPNSLSFTSVGATSMTINWGNVIGNAIVVLRQGSAPSADPVDETTYTADPDFTSGSSSTIGTGGKVVYIGSGTSVTVTDLTADTEYFVRIYNFNGSGGTQNYRQTSPLAGSESTVEPHIWTGGGANANWTTGGNWSDGAPPGASDVAIFRGTVGMGPAISIDAASSVAGIRFEASATTAFTFSGANALTIGSSGIEVESGSAAHTFDNDIVLGAGQTWDLAENLTVGGIISGSGNLTKAGTGRLTLSGNNTFTGNVQLNAGIIEIEHVNGLGNASGSMTVASGATLELNAGGNYAQPLTINGTGVGGNGALRKMDSSTRRYDATITLGSDARINVDGGTLELRDDVDLDSHTLYVGGSLNVDMAFGSALLNAGKTSGAGAIVKDGAGFFQLRPTASQPAGSITINNGELRTTGTIPAGGVLTLADGTAVMSSSSAGRTITKNMLIAGDVVLGATATRTGALTINGNVDLDGADREIDAPVDHTINGIVSNGGLTKAGAGRLTLAGANTFASDLNVTAGYVQLTTDDDAGGLGDINVSDGATLELNNNGTWSQDINLAGLGVSSGPSLDLIRNSTLSGAITLTGNSWIRRTDDYSFSTTLDGALNLGTYQLDITSEDRPIIMGSSSSMSGSGTLYVDMGTEEFDYRPDASHTGSIILNAGEMHQTLATMPAGGTFTMRNGTTFRSDGSANRTIAKNMVIEGNITLGAGSDVITITGTVGLDSGTRTVTTVSDVNMDGIISDGGLTKAGAGKLTLSAANTYASGTTVSAGTLEGTTTSLQGNIVNNSALIYNQSGDGTYAGQISGTGTLTKQGSGTVTLSGTSTYSGNSTVSAGGLIVNGTIANSAFTVASGATLFGNGEVDGLTVSGTVRPGASASAIGSLDVSSLTMNNGSIGRFKIGDASNTANRDFIANGGSATINATVTIAIDDSQLSNFNAANNYTWVLIQGGISSVANFSLDDSSHWSTALAGGSFDLVANGNNLELQFTASIAEPTTQATSIQFSNIETTSMTVSWTVGNGANRIVVARAGSAVSTDPSDNTTYSANAAFGSGDTTSAGNFVVYNGSGSSVAVSGLSAGTDYHFRVYEYNGSGGQENYFTDTATGNPASQETMFAEPTTQASSITFSGINQASLTGINFTSGNGNSRIVVAKAGSAVDELPVDGTSYSAGSSALTSGSHLGGGNYVVHVGSGPFDVTSLSHNTVYHFRVFEFNGSGVTANYKTETATGNPASQTTLATLPSSSVSDLAITARGTDSLSISWTKGGGADNTLILVKTVAISTSPTDANGYTANASFGSGDAIDGAYVVYKSSGTSMTITDLSPDTQYFIQAYPFNGSSGSENYRVGSPAAVDGYTLGTEPDAQAHTVVFTSRTAGGMTIGWSGGNGAGSLVILREGDAPSGGPTDGTAGYSADSDFSGSGTALGNGKIVYIGSGASVAVTGLNPATEYHAQVFEFNGSGGTANYFTDTASGNPNSAYTLSTEPSAHGTLTAAGASPSSIDLEWTAATGANGYVIVRKQGSEPTTAIPEDGAAAYSVGNTIGDGTVVFVSTSGAAGSTTDSHGSMTADTVYHYAIFPYAYDGTPANATYNYKTDATPGSANASTFATEPTTQARDITIDTHLEVRMEGIDWTNGDGLGRVVVAKADGPVDSFPVDGASYTANTAFGSGTELGTGNYVIFAGTGNGPIAEISELDRDTIYHFQVFEYSGVLGTTANFNTDPGATDNPISQTTIAAQPADDPATDLLASPIGSTTATLSWTPGTGDGVLVLMRAEGAVSQSPADGVRYEADAVFGDGAHLGDGVYSVYRGTGSSVEVTGLTPGTVYHIRVFMWNGSSAGAENYRIGGAPTYNFTTLAAEPTQASNITFSNVGPDSMDVEWTNGDVDGRIVVATAYDAAGMWLFDEGSGTSVADATVSGHDGSFIGSPTWTTRGDAGALQFSGSDQLVEIDTMPLGDTTPSAFSISVWVYSTKLDTEYDYIVHRGNGSSIGTSIYSLNLHTGDDVSWAVNGRFDEGRTGVTTADIQNQWVHMVGTYDGTDAKFYLNGVLEHTDAGVGAIVKAATGNKLGFAGTPHDTDFRNFQGSLSEPMIFDRALSAAEIEDLYQMTSMGTGWVPTDGVAPAGVNADFSAATDQGFGSKIVYNGTGAGNEVSVTGLDPVTMYRFRVFEYSGSGGTINYNTSTAANNPNDQATTDYDPPTLAAALLSVTDFTENSIDLEWTRGNGNDVLVVARATDAAEEPTDDVDYTANAAFGSGGQVGTDSRAVYNDNGTTVPVTGLSAATLYQFAAYEYLNHTGDRVRYRTGDAPTVSRWTLSTEPANHVTGFTAGNPSSSSIDLSWTAAAGSPAPDGYLIVRRANANPTFEPEDGNSYTGSQGDSVVTVVTGGASTSQTVSGLLPETTYYFRIYPFRRVDGEAETFNYKTDGAVPSANETTAPSLQIVDQFDGYSGDLDGENGGTGWGGDWSVTMANQGTATTTINTGSLNVPDGYPDSAGDKVQVALFEGLTSPSFQANRTFDEAFTEGDIYASAILNYAWNNPGVYLGMSLMDGSEEKVFVGRPWQNSEVFGADSFGAGQELTSKNFNGGSEYLVIVHYNFETKQLRGLIYNSTVTGVPPEAEPGTWDFEVTVPADRISQITGLRIGGGNNAGTNRFDEVRVGNTWRGMLGLGGSDENLTPTIQAAQFNVFMESTNQFSVTVNRGNGANVLILAREGAAVDATPVDGETYTANTAFGSGDQIGSGNYVVYNGPDSFPSFTLTGLDIATTYHLRAFEYNDASGTKYLTDEAPPRNPYSYTTLSPPSGISVGLAGETATQLSWSLWNSRYVMVVYNVGSAVTFRPVDGVDYSTGAQTGGTILHAGTTDQTSAEHTGLTADTTVHYAFFSRNSGSGNHFYSEPVISSITLTQPELLVYDGFDVPNEQGLDQNSNAGGVGWSGNWSTSDSYNDNAGATVYDSGSLPFVTAAGDVGNKAKFFGANNNRSITSTRSISSAISSDTIYISWRQNHGFSGSDKSAGIMFQDSSGNDEFFVGKHLSSDALELYDVGLNSSQTTGSLSAGSGADYLYVVKVEFNASGTDEIVSVRAYENGESLLGEEPAVWDLVVTNSISDIGRVRLIANAQNDAQIGLTFFDEIRIGENWTETVRYDGQQYRTMMEQGPVPELLYIGRNFDAIKPATADANFTPKTAITDADLAANEDLDIAIRWYSPFGVFATNNTTSLNTRDADAFLSSSGNVVPNFDPLRTATDEPDATGSDAMFDKFIGHNGDQYIISYVTGGLKADDDIWTGWEIDDGFFITVSAQTYPDSGAKVDGLGGRNQVPDRRAFTINVPVEFFIIDDDPAPPILQSFDTLEFTDAEMQEGVTIGGEVLDEGSGVIRDSLMFSLENPEATAIVENQLFATRPASNGAARLSVETLEHTLSGVNYADNRIGEWALDVMAKDADADRFVEAVNIDQEAITNRFTITVIDDDTEPPKIGEDRVTVLLDETELDAVVLGAEDLLAGFNFNNDGDRLAVGHGEGSLTLGTGAGSVSYVQAEGTTQNAVSGDPAEQGMSIGSTNLGRTITFQLDMTDRWDLEMTFASRRTGGYTANQIAYSIDNSAWTDFGAAFDPGTSWGTQTVGFSSVTELTHRSTVYIRITVGGSSEEGTISFDNFQFNTQLSPPIVLASWNFNTPATFEDSTGGVLSGDRAVLTHTLGNITDFGGTSLNLLDGDSAGQDFAPRGTENNGQYFQFELDMRGFRVMEVSFAAQRSNTGYNNNTLSYSVDGGEFVTYEAGWNPSTSYSVKRMDLTQVAALENAELLFIRVTLNGATDASGNNRFDNFQFRTESAKNYEITDAQLATVSAENPLRFRFNVYDEDSGIVRAGTLTGPRETQGMKVSVPGLIADDEDFSVADSDVDTTLVTATTEWRQTSLDPATITEMYGIGQMRSITGFVSDDDFNRPDDNLTMENAHFGQWRIVDDDVRPPELRNVSYREQSTNPSHPFLVFVSNTMQSVSSGGTTNATITITDADLRYADDRNLELVFGVIDRDSNVSRPGEWAGGNSTSSVLNISIGDLVTGNYANFNVDRSSAAGSVTTNVWTFSNFTAAEVGNFFTAGTLPINVTMVDADNDRENDQSRITAQAGYIRVVDDDTKGPIIAQAMIVDGADPELIRFTGFESDGDGGWPAENSGGDHVWTITNSVNGRVWQGDGAIRTTFDPYQGVRRIGLAANQDAWLQMPPLEEPGVLSFMAARYGTTEAGNVELLLQQRVDDAWENLSSVMITNRYTIDGETQGYEMYSFAIGQSGIVTARLFRAESPNQVLLDNFDINPVPAWSNLDELEIQWTEAVDDKSGVDEYRFVAPTVNPDPLANETSGTHIANSVTNTTVVLNAADEGLLIGYLAAIDGDNDRPGDRAKGGVRTMVARIDRTPPIAVSDLAATDAEGGIFLGFDDIDETVEIGVEWTAFASEAAAAGPRSSDSEPLSPWDSFVVTYYDADDLGNPLPNATTQTITRQTSGFTNLLNQFDLNGVVIPDLSFDTYYRIGISGRDEAGNYGPTNWALGNTARFVVTQGVARTSSESEIYWTASVDSQTGAVTREYDLIYGDQSNYGDFMQQQSRWGLVDTVQSNWAPDNVSIAANMMRFYRATPTGRWGEDKVRPVASEEVYVAKPVTLYAGQNWVGFPGIPDEVTVARVFGHTLPAGNAATGTKVTWFERAATNATGAVATSKQIYLASGGQGWQYVVGGSGSADNALVDLSHGVVIELPDGSGPVETFLFVGRVPTPAVEHAQEQTIQPGDAYNLVNMRLPNHLHPNDMGLFEAGFAPRTKTSFGDIIFKWDRSLQAVPLVVYYNSGLYGFPPGWYTMSGVAGAVPAGHFGPDDGLIINTRGSTTEWTWTNTVPYSAPTRFLE
jgi:autotransporter-associated beta strand protein